LVLVSFSDPLLFMSTRTKKTTVGTIDDDVLAFTAGKDIVLDLQLVEADCLGSAAHAIMLSRMKVKPPVLTKDETKRIIAVLGSIREMGRIGTFKITPADQDVHLAIENHLTLALGDIGKKIHTGRSRNDQVALDLRLFARARLQEIMEATLDLAVTMMRWGKKHAMVPMVGRTHMQPAMPSTVGLWATSFTEALFDDLELLSTAYRLNNRSPLGAAAGYGVPLPIDRELTSRLLVFEEPVHNVMYAINARGKLETVILEALGQVMLTLSRLAQDFMIYTMPEFGYFTLPPAFCTGSSIMPNKQNPDVMELIRSRAAVVHAYGQCCRSILLAAPSGYNRDLQDTKEPLLEGLASTLASLRIAARCVADTTVNSDRLRASFTPGVFATDRAVELVGQGVPFRDAYHQVKSELGALAAVDPDEAVRRKTHTGTTGGLNFDLYSEYASDWKTGLASERRRVDRAMNTLMKTP